MDSRRSTRGDDLPLERFVRSEKGSDPEPPLLTTPPRRRGAVAETVRTVWLVMRANPLTLLGFLVVVVMVVTALVVGLTPILTHLLLGHSLSATPYPVNSFSTSDASQGPSPRHWMGTDSIGTDIFSQVLAALPLDLVIAFSVAGIALVAGGTLGIIAGYFDTPGTLGGAGATIILRVTDVFLAFPSLVLALAVAASLGRGTEAAVIALLVTWWPYYVRLARGEVLAVRHLPYITAARAAGVTDGTILGRHVLRNILEPLVVYYTLDVGTVLVTFSTISYVGIGVPFGVPEWGNMIEQYAGYLATLPWTVVGPGLAVFVTVLGFSLLGDGLRDILDPRSRRILSQGPAVDSTSAAPIAAPAAGEKA
jgi:peptide/nickel transport system permease protein